MTQSGGGVAKIIEQIVRASVGAAHTVVAPPSAFSPAQRSRMATRFIECDMVRNINPLEDLRSILKLKSILLTEEFDILHLHSSKAGMLGRLASILGRKHTPIIFSPHGWSFHPNMNSLAHLTFATLERLAARLADDIVCVSDSELLYGRMHRVHPRKNMIRIYNGVDVDSFRPNGSKEYYREMLGLPRESFVYAVNARIAPGKSPLEIMRAFRIVIDQCPDSYLVYVGDGPLRAELQSLGTALKLEERVFYAGWVDDVRPYLWAADAGILITQWEAFGLAAVESLAAGLPCVVSGEGPMKEILDETVGVIVNNYHEPTAIADGMLDVRRKKFDSSKCTARAMRFSAHRMVQEYDRLYQEVALTPARR
ncbi:glycosyltransferase [Alicyclobacillus herbarius]|uniref:glycosyltransferase n=1 Tax=Alicyclobacillus herbarius TaxID=122960 RepID=UPI00047AF16B|nr:glycosyltransferase [Alicyclobacillus herbarius]